MTDKQFKETLESKKEDIKSALKNRATYDKWDKHSSIWIYDIWESKIEEIIDVNKIKNILIFNDYCCYGVRFLNKKDAEIYKWVMDLTEKQVEQVLSNIPNEYYFGKFVDVKDLSIGDKNEFYVADYIDLCKGAMDEYYRKSKHPRINRPNINKDQLKINISIKENT